MLKQRGLFSSFWLETSIALAALAEVLPSEINPTMSLFFIEVILAILR